MHESSNEKLIPGSFRQFNMPPELFRIVATVPLGQQSNPILLRKEIGGLSSYYSKCLIIW
jgi:hypothetical protein